MINQYFNVYALRRVRTAGYATDTGCEHWEMSYCYGHIGVRKPSHDSVCIL